MDDGCLPLGDDDVPAGLDHGHPVGVEQLPVPLPHLPELKLEPALLVEYLNSVIVGVGDYNVILSIHCHSAWLGKLSLQDSEFSKFAVIDHLLSFNLGFWRVEGGGHGRGGEGRALGHGG